MPAKIDLPQCAHAHAPPGYFDEVAKKCAELGDELWLRGFVTRFLGKLVFSHGRMTVAIEIAEIALAVVT